MRITRFAIVLVCFMLHSSITFASLTVPYIKPMLLGRTFDYSKSTVGNDIYPRNVRENPLVRNHFKTQVSYSMVRRAKDIRDVLDISGHLSVQIMAGLLDIKGRGIYLKESSESGNFVEVLAKISYQTVTKQITDDQKPVKNWDKRPIIGQHYVRSITYGGNLIASLKFHAKNDKDKKNVEVKVDASLKAGSAFGLSVGGQFKKLASSVKDISTLTISYTATAPLKSVPTDIDSLVQAIKDFPSMVKTIDGGIGVPIDAEIVPLSQLSGNPKLKFLLDGSIKTKLTDLESMYYDLRTTADAVKKFLKRNPLLSVADETTIGKFYTKIFKITETFNNVIANINLNGNSKTGNDFKTAFDAYRDGGILLPDKFIRQYKILAAKLERTDTGITTGSLIAFHASLENVGRRFKSGIIKFDKTDFNIGGGYNNKTSVFKAPLKGVYQFTVSVLPSARFTGGKPGREAASFDIMKGKKTYSRVQSHPNAKGTQVSKTVLILLQKGETVFIKLKIGSVRGTRRYSTFGGFLLRAL